MLFHKDYNRPLRFALAFVISIVITAPVIGKSQYLQFIDISLTGDVQKHETAFLHVWYTLVSFFGSPKTGILWTLLIAFLLWGFKYKIQALWAMGAVYGGDVIDEIIKNLVKRPRPALHPAADTSYSFPSGHVFSTFLIISVLWFVAVPMIKRAKLRWLVYVLCVVWVGMVVLARIYLNAHYPTDTLGALAIAYTWLQICEWLYIVIGPRLKRWRLTQHSYL